MDQLERIANILDGGDNNKGTVNQKSYLERIANKLETDGGSDSGEGGGSSSGGGVVYIESTEDNNIVTFNASYNDIVEYLEAGKTVYMKIPRELQEESGYSESGFFLYPCASCLIINGFDDDGEPKTTYQVSFFAPYGNMTIDADTPSDNFIYVIDSDQH